MKGTKEDEDDDDYHLLLDQPYKRLLIRLIGHDEIAIDYGGLSPNSIPSKYGFAEGL